MNLSDGWWPGLVLSILDQISSCVNVNQTLLSFNHNCVIYFGEKCYLYAYVNPSDSFTLKTFEQLLKKELISKITAQLG